ncbi:hypothetical protein H9P43_004163 [Blastocladiella emersonii ATCC 22665]|nr:hypothetical protein H9P43_004163 [Blastocladiella emersonii ATCC 22665]
MQPHHEPPTDVESPPPPPPPEYERVAMFRVTMLGVGFLLVLTAFNVAESRITLMFPEHGFNSMAIIYFFLVFSSVLAPYLTHRVPIRVILFVSTLFYALFIVSMNFDVTFLFIASALTGCAAGALWVHQGYYVSVAASCFGVDVGKLSGRFLLVFTANMIAGNVVSLLLLNMGVSVTMLLYVMVGMALVGSAILAMLPEPRPATTVTATIDPDAPADPHATLGDQVRIMGRLLATAPLPTLLPVFMWSGSISCLAFGNYPAMLPRDAPSWLLPGMCTAFGVTGTLASPVWGKVYDARGPMPLVGGAVVLSVATYAMVYVAVLAPTTMSPTSWTAGMALLGALDNVTNCLINFCIAGWFGNGPETAPAFSLYRAVFSVGFILLSLLSNLGMWQVVLGCNHLLTIGTVVAFAVHHRRHAATVKSKAPREAEHGRGGYKEAAKVDTADLEAGAKAKASVATDEDETEPLAATASLVE